MIKWLIQSMDDYPAWAGCETPPAWLSDAERARYAGLKTEKRRQDWLLGRWTAKRLVQDVLQQQGDTIPLHNLVIDNWASGEPYVQLPNLPINQSPLSLSISHSHGRAFCAVWPQANRAIGADLERIAPRSDAFVADYFTKAEIACLDNGQSPIANRQSPTADYELRDTLATAVWSAKEAVLKALHLGLTVDTRSVSCLVRPLTENTWTPFDIELDRRRLGDNLPLLSGWQRAMGDFVLTLVIQN